MYAENVAIPASAEADCVVAPCCYGTGHTKGVRRILVRGVNAPLPLEAKKIFENLLTKWCILKYI